MIERFNRLVKEGAVRNVRHEGHRPMEEAILAWAGGTGDIGMARCVLAASSVPGSASAGRHRAIAGWRCTGVR